MLTHFSLKHFMDIFLSHFPQGCYLWILVQNQIVCIKKYHILLPRSGKWARVGELKDRCDVPKGLWLLWIFSHPHLAPAFFQHVPSVTFWPLSGRLPVFSLPTVYLFIYFKSKDHTAPRRLALCRTLWPQLSCGSRNPCVSWRMLVFFLYTYFYADKGGCPCLRGPQNSLSSLL